MKKKKILCFIFICFLFLLGTYYVYSKSRYDIITLAKEPDNIFTNNVTNNIAVVIDGQLAVYDENGFETEISTRFNIEYVCPFDDAAMVTDDSGNLYRIDFSNAESMTVTNYNLSNIVYVDGYENTENNQLNYYVAINRKGEAYVWGNNQSNRLGISEADYIEKPIKLDYISNINKIDIADSTSILLTNDGNVYQAGLKFYEDSKEICYEKFEILEFNNTVIDIHNGYYAMVVCDNDIKYWSSQEYTENRDESKYFKTNWKEKDIVTFSSGGKFYLGMSKDGHVYYWGYDIIHTSNCKCDGFVVNPTLVRELENAEMIYAGYNVGYVKKGLELIILKRD